MNSENKAHSELSSSKPPAIPDICHALRSEIHVLEQSARDMLHHQDLKPGFFFKSPIRTNLDFDEHQTLGEEQTFKHGEILANIMLAVRHLEDARMRLGKVIQYNGDGVSCYDK